MSDSLTAPATLSEFAAALRAMPPRTVLDAGELAGVLERYSDAVSTMRRGDGPPVGAQDWRERLWTCPPETRLGRDELLAALGRPRSWLYRHTSAKDPARRIPHRRFEGALVFVVGDVRRWLREREEGAALDLGTWRRVRRAA